MRNTNIYIILTILLLIAASFVYQYIFSIYEVTYSVDRQSLSPDNKSTATITVIPINAWGWKAPFRTSSARFEIIEGADLVKVITNNPKAGIFTIQAKTTPGKIIIRVKSVNSLFPSEITIVIEPNVA